VEKLTNCEIIIDIGAIEQISGGNQVFEIVFSAKTGEKYKLLFNYVWDMRCATENAFFDRGSKFIRGEKQKNSVYLIENSDYIKYFESQVSGTLPIDELKNYILFDAVDTVVEVLTLNPPILEVLP